MGRRVGSKDKGVRRRRQMFATGYTMTGAGLGLVGGTVAGKAYGDYRSNKILNEPLKETTTLGKSLKVTVQNPDNRSIRSLKARGNGLKTGMAAGLLTGAALGLSKYIRDRKLNRIR